jgi:hypothetical protein
VTVVHSDLSPTAFARFGSFLQRWDDPASRRRIYRLLAVLYFALGWLVAGGKALQRHEQIDFVLRDAEGYYIYLPSLLISGDLNFTKQLLVHSAIQDVNRNAFDSVLGGQRDKYPIGTALTLAPAFLVGHVVALGLSHLSDSIAVAPTGYSLPYQLMCIAAAMAMGCWGMCLADGMLTREFRQVRGRTIAAGVLVYWIGTNYAYYFFREPLMAHLISSTWVIAAVSVCQRIITAARVRTFVGWHWPALAAATSMAIISRFTDAIALLPLLLIVAIMTTRAGLLIAIIKRTPLILPAAAPLLLQLIVTRQVTGQLSLTNPRQLGYHTHEIFYWTDPALLKTLVSSRHGLLFWSPVLIVSLVGILIYLLRGGWRNAWLVGLTLGGLLLWFINSAWWCWAFGTSFGARAFVDIAALFITGMTLAFHELTTAPRAFRITVFAFVALTTVYSYAMMSLFILKVLPRDDYLFPHPGINPPPGLDSYYRPLNGDDPQGSGDE